MKRTALLVTLLLAAGAANANQRQVAGVPWDAVDWEKLCKNVKPLVYTSSNGQVCPKVHPTATQWSKWHDITGSGRPEPKWHCSILARQYEHRVKSVGKCKSGFGFALRDRVSDPEAYEEPLTIWRARYFGPWIPGN